MTFALCLFSVTLRVQAQQAAPSPSPAWLTARIHLQTQGKTLPQVVALLGHELHCSIVMDDAPVLPPPDLNIEGTGRQVMDKVCDAYDYNWKVGKRGIALLTKRFGNPDEMPQMHLADLQQMTRDMLTAFSGVTCSPRPDQWVQDCRTLYDACTIRQLETLKQGGPVNYAELNAEQQGTLADMLLNHRFAKIISCWKDLAEWLDLVPLSCLQVRDQPQELDWIGRRRDKTERYLRLKTFAP